jgi:hypothetical protein
VVRHRGDGMTLAGVHVSEKAIDARVARTSAHSPQWKTMWTVAPFAVTLVGALVQTVIESLLVAV